VNELIEKWKVLPVYLKEKVIGTLADRHSAHFQTGHTSKVDSALYLGLADAYDLVMQILREAENVKG
jgi:hypothetical protein